MAQGVSYTLVFVNNSSQTGDACVYQQGPNLTDPKVMSLAWFSKRAFPTTRLRFNWNIDYSFMWSETGHLQPGVLFSASQTWPADLSTMNQVQFANDRGAYTFLNQTAGPNQGSLTIKENSTIPANQASVGIGMSGSGTFVVQAQPNMNAIFTPHPEYWITFGDFIQGEVLDITTVTSSSAKIEFPVNVFSMTATLRADNTWSVMPTSAANAAFLATRQNDAKAVWGNVAV
jgi:hypothetical protein